MAHNNNNNNLELSFHYFKFTLRIIYGTANEETIKTKTNKNGKISFGSA